MTSSCIQPITPMKNDLDHALHVNVQPFDDHMFYIIDGGDDLLDHTVDSLNEYF
jgi:hypothetical protein